MDLFARPQTGFIAVRSRSLKVRLVLHRDGVEGDPVAVLHGGHVVGQVAGVGGIVGLGVNIVATIDAAVVLEVGRRAPRCAPDPGTEGRGLLCDRAFRVVNDTARCDARAQQ